MDADAGAVSLPQSGPVVLRTLADHRAFTLSAFCQACDRSVVLDKSQLADRYGWDVRLEDIRRRLKCQQCGRPADRLAIGWSGSSTIGGGVKIGAIVGFLVWLGADLAYYANTTIFDLTTTILAPLVTGVPFGIGGGVLAAVLGRR